MLFNKPLIDHFTVVWSLNESEAGVELNAFLYNM